MKTEIVPKSNTPKTKRGEDRQKKLLNTAIKVFWNTATRELLWKRSSLTPAALAQPSIRYTDPRKDFSRLPEEFGGRGLFRIRRTLRRVSSLGRGAHCFGRVFLTSILDDRAVNTSRLIFSQAAKDPDIGNWYYTEGAELSYLCFAKVLENKLPLSLEELKPLAQHYIEMLKADLYMKRLCGVSVSLNDQIISDEVRLCADIFIKYLKSRMTQT